ncbi:MAG: hypothetical protein BGP24_18165 [Lysobacterales bacterium 69-70]|nr:DUF4123 domain-containing protein [Xanthomonadaceae bacterium]ODU32702.1 MAG: hypothetical protein ABS97_15325 [Xanthomonadaceae bacterium SCN 69-320]ODV19213.1 MAG: hypothetical protein ABT27_11840 [Xanthomonadaceae bacterium SCN 69-25]OJY99694.1 MAG: hypothetical protein BGP24_18165 [Xanthomonadales bacterium 69-70]
MNRGAVGFLGRWFERQLQAEAGPCFALIDCARHPQLPALLTHAAVRAQSLFDGVEALRLQRYGAWVAPFPAHGELASIWFGNGGQGWREAWGWLFQSPAGIDELRRHFKKFLQVDLPQGGRAYWRFYDPRVICRVLPVMRQEQHEEFLGRLLRRVYCVDPALNTFYTVWPRESGLGQLLGSRPLDVHAQYLPAAA